MEINYASQLDYFWVLAPEVVITIFALVILMVDVFQRGESQTPARLSIAWLTVIALLVAAVANTWLLTLEDGAPAGPIAVDSFRVFTNYLFLGGALLFVPLSWRYLGEERMRHGELFVLVLLTTLGMMFFAGTRNLMLMFLGLELMSVAVYVLTAVNRRDRRSAEAGLKYFLLGAFSSAFFLFGIALLYGATGSVNLALIHQAIEATGPTAMANLGMGMLAVGFGFKVSAVPFHMWTPDAYEGAPAPVTAFMAAAVKAAAFAAFLRVFLTGLGGLFETWAMIVFWLAIVTMVAANLMALPQDSVKRMLAYSSIAHAGYLLVALRAANVMGVSAFLYYLVVYTLMTMGAFAVVYIVAHKHELRLGLAEYSGLGWRAPLIGITMTVFLLSLAGVPPTGGFWGKFAILRAIVDQGGSLTLAVVLVMTSLISYYYYLRVAWFMWFREAKPDALALPVSRGVGAVLVVSAVAVILIGIFPAWFLDVAQSSAMSLMRLPLAPGIAGP